jgi:WD40 repeat protein
MLNNWIVIRRKYFMKLKTNIIGLFFISVFIGCGLFESSGNDGASDKVYVALQGLDQVAIVDVDSGEVDTINIDYSQGSNTPHFIVIDEINRYWFVTTISSGYVGCYNLDTDELIDTVLVGDSPALMALNESSAKLYVSRMMPMGGMMTGAVSTIINEIDYSNPVDMFSSNEFEVSSPAPHGLAINQEGSEIYVISNTADWLYKIIIPENEETEQIVGVVMDVNSPNIEFSNIEVDRLKPIQCVSVNNSLLVVTCSAGITYDLYSGNDTIPGHIQLWDTVTMTLLDTVQFNWKSKPWHIINSPVNEEAFVALSGDNLYPRSAGVACLTYASDTLAINWETYSEDFEALHGIDVSADGKNLFVSGRGDGNLHIFHADSGEKIKSISLGHNPSAAGISTVYK